MGTKAGTGMSHHRSAAAAGEEAVRAALRQGGIDRPDFLFMFASIGYDQEALLAAVQKAAGGVPLAGCSGEGVIVGDEPDESNFSVGVMAIQSDEIKLENGLITDMKRDVALAGRALVESIRPRMTGREIGLILLPDAVSFNFDQFLAGIEGEMPGFPLPIWGGAAAENWSWVPTYQYCDDRVASDAVSFVLLSGGLRATWGISHGCVPIGAERTITKCSGRTVQEIDGKPALDVLVEYMGEEQVNRWQELPAVLGIGIAAPGVLQGSGRLLIRAMVGGKDDVARTFNVVADAKVGDKIWMTRRDYEKIRSGVDEIAAEIRRSLRGRQPKIVLQFECGGRGQLLLTPRERQDVLSSLRGGVGPDAPWLGFYTYAEIGPVDGHNCLHNYTAVVLVLHDAPEAEEHEDAEPDPLSVTPVSPLAEPPDTVRFDALEEQNRSLSEQVKRLVDAEHKVYRAQEKLEEQLHLYRQLYEKGKQLNATLDVGELLAVATSYVVYTMNFQRCVVLLRDAAGGDLAVAGFEGYYEPEVSKPLVELRLGPGDDLAKPASPERHHLSWSVGETPAGLTRVAEVLGMDGGGVAVPLQMDALTVGGWILAGNTAARRQYHAAADGDGAAVVGLANLASQISIAIKNARLYAEQVETNEALRRSRLALESRVKQLETVAYVATHDLRGGADQAQYDAEELAGLLGELPEEVVEQHDLGEIVRNIAAATRQQVTVLDGIEAMVKLWKNDQLDVEAFEARPFVEQKIRDVDAFAGEDIRVEDLGVVTANKGMFWTILFNLIKNALKYNDKPHKEVRIRRTEGSIHVEDNGNGIPDDKLGVVTQIFQRLDRTKEGKGLGLAICEAMIQKHGWALSIRSRLGEGSTFTITF